MIRKRNNKSSLYESIMRDLAKTVKKNLNENTFEKKIIHGNLSFRPIKNDDVNFEQLSSISDFNLASLEKLIKLLKQTKNVDKDTPIIFETTNGYYYPINNFPSVRTENINGKDYTIIFFGDSNYDANILRKYDKF